MTTKNKDPSKWDLVEEAVDENNKIIRFWTNDDYGNIMEADGKFLAMVPKIVKIGPFSSLNEAQRALVGNDEALDLLLENFNQSIDLTKEVKLETSNLEELKEEPSLILEKDTRLIR